MCGIIFFHIRDQAVTEWDILNAHYYCTVQWSTTQVRSVENKFR